MITAFTVRNFKAIGNEPVRIELKPITLLFGANSAGKSSILHALYYAYEVFNNHNLNVEKILIGENNILDLGGFKRFVHNDKDESQSYLSRSIIIRFELDFTKSDVSSFFSDPLVNNKQSKYSSNLLNLLSLSDKTTAYVEVEISWRDIKKCPYVSRYETGVNSKKIATIYAEPSSGMAVINYLNYTHEIFENFEKNHNINLYALVEKCINHWFYTPHTNTLNLGLLYSPYNALPEDWLSFGDVWNEQTIDIGKPDLKIDFEDLFNTILVAPKKLVAEWLEAICYLGPLREIPPRYSSDNNTVRYLHEPNFNSKRWVTGLGAWDFLYWIGQQNIYESRFDHDWIPHRNSSGIYDYDYGYEVLGSPEDFTKEAYSSHLDIINNWLSSERGLNTGYEVHIELYREISSEIFTDFFKDKSQENMSELIKKILSQPEKMRIWLYDKSRNLDLTPHEIGIGISQVLPVVVAAVAATATLVVIEQPELHIHPAIQVQLGDLFITQSNDKKFFFIETHSEHLLLRILRRIRETAEGQAPEEAKLLPNEVAVYYVESENGITQANRIGLDENGRFTDRWPRGFFEEREKEYFGEQQDLSDELGRLFGK